MNLSEILKMRGFDLEAKTKMVRHKDNKLQDDKQVGGMSLQTLYYDHPDLLEFYQKCQTRNIFDNAEYAISFLGEEGSRSKLLGIYKVGEKSKLTDKMIPEKYRQLKLNIPGLESGINYYELEKVSGFEDLENRLVIDWGKGAIKWDQYLSEVKPKDVIEILPDGFFSEFPGYENVIITYSELCRIMNKPEANRSWQIALSKVSGVYLILDRKTG